MNEKDFAVHKPVPVAVSVYTELVRGAAEGAQPVSGSYRR